MWLKLDDGFATHPKILDAGPEALIVQIRALCYASQNRTDGRLPLRSIPLFLVGLNHEINWLEHMVTHGLWEPVAQGYQIHDYLDWNVSKREYESFINKKRKAGKKGMQTRWGKGLPRITAAITPVITDDITKRYHPTSTSTSLLNPLKTPNPKTNLRSNGRARLSKGKREISEEDHPTEKHFSFGQSLKLDVGPEWGKFKNYCLAHGKRYANFEAAFRNWLANADQMKGKRP